MKSRMWILPFAILFLAMGTLVSCGDGRESPMEEAAREVEQAAETAARWTEEQAQDFYRDMEVAIENFKGDLERFRAEPPEEESAKQEWERRIDDFQEKIDRAETKLSQLKEEAGDEWERMKEDLEEAIEEIRDKIDDMKSSGE